MRVDPIILALAVTTALPGRGLAGPVGWNEVSAILEKRCVNCHSEHGAGKGLRLDSYAAAVAGSESGAVLIPGDIEGSELARRILGVSTPRMPFLAPPLPDDEKAVILDWILGGLPE
jgi:hypothetical protein